MRGPQRRALDAALVAAAAANAVDRVGRAGDHAGARAVDRGQRRARRAAARRTSASAERDGEHRRRPACACISRPAGGDQPQRVLAARRRRRGSAATYSPMLWPSIAAGSHAPRPASSRARAYSTANSAGWASAVCRSRSSASASPARRAASRRSQAELAAQEQLGAARPRRRGDAARSRTARAPMPAYCAPWPENRKATRGRAGPRPPATAARGVAPARRRRRRRRRRPRRRRCGERRRPTRSVYATSARSQLAGARPGARRAFAPRRPARVAVRADRAAGAPAAAGAAVRGARRRLLQDDVRVGAADAERADRRPGAAPPSAAQSVSVVST